jgi:hypothetical protein
MVAIPDSRFVIPPLENGDRLSRAEFERRYEAMPRLKKAELVEGVVYMASPLRIKSHGEPHGDITGWLWTYKTATPGVILGIEPTVRLDLENEPQPDAVLLVPGRQATIGAAIDLHDKKRAYRRNQVQEYIVWRTLEAQLDWFVLEADEYRVQLPDDQGIVRSRIFPGLWLAVSALLAGDMATVLSVLQQGLNSPERPAFVRSLHS